MRKRLVLFVILQYNGYIEKGIISMEYSQQEKLRIIAEEMINDNLYRIIISRPLLEKEITKIAIRPVMLQKRLQFQETRYVGTKVFHENYGAGEIKAKIISYMQGDFGQLEAECADKKVVILANKKGTLTIKKKNYHKENLIAPKAQDKLARLSHNRKKEYLLPEGEPVDFLVELGVMLPNGQIVKSKYDKFKQINRYLEFIEDVLPTIQKEGTIRIIDFGCGKAYLTFALYYYLCEKKKYAVEIVGLDLKKDVIETCNRLKDKLGYRGLTFLRGDIKDYEKDGEVDMVVTLHACDTATDYAIAKAVQWNAKVIMTVPCCQHEWNKQIACKEMEDILKYGIIKEKMSALLTDAYRANCLEKAGYDTQILEFIDMEHTPKNILIRATKKGEQLRMKAGLSPKETKEETHSKERDGLQRMEEFWNVQPTLKKLLFEEKQ